MHSEKALGNRHGELKVAVGLFQIQHAYQQCTRLVEACKCSLCAVQKIILMCVLSAK